MTKDEWQQKYGFDDEEMEQIVFWRKLFNGKIIKVFDKNKKEIK